MGEEPPRALRDHVEVSAVRDVASRMRHDEHDSCIALVLLADRSSASPAARPEPRAPADGGRAAHAAGADAAAAITLRAEPGARPSRSRRSTRASTTANNATRKGFADQKLIIDNIGERRAASIRERTDDTNVRIGSLREELEALRTIGAGAAAGCSCARAAARRRSERAGRSECAATAPAPAPPPAPLPSTAGLSPTRMFETARRRLLRRPVRAGDHRLRGVPQGVPAVRAGRRRAVLHRRDATTRRTSWRRAIAAYNRGDPELPDVQHPCPRRTTSAGWRRSGWDRSMPRARRGKRSSRSSRTATARGWPSRVSIACAPAPTPAERRDLRCHRIRR